MIAFTLPTPRALTIFVILVRTLEAWEGELVGNWDPQVPFSGTRTETPALLSG